MTDKPDHYTIREFCKRAPMGKTRLYELLKAGKIAAKKDGQRILIPAESYEAWKNSLPDYLGATLGAEESKRAG